MVRARAVLSRKLSEMPCVGRMFAADDNHDLDVLRKLRRFELTVVRIGADRIHGTDFVVFDRQTLDDLGETDPDQVDWTTTPTRLARGNASTSSAV